MMEIIAGPNKILGSLKSFEVDDENITFKLYAAPGQPYPTIDMAFPYPGKTFAETIRNIGVVGLSNMTINFNNRKLSRNTVPVTQAVAPIDAVRDRNRHAKVLSVSRVDKRK